MGTAGQQRLAAKQGAEDAGKYFRYMSEFVGFTAEDTATIRQTKPIIEKHLPEIVSKFYTHLLRYPPTRQWFLKSGGTLDQEYVELRMRHLTHFWLRTASGVFDDEYARYVDYVGRAHTSHGADPHIYIAERYVIGQVGFVQHAISDVIIKEMHPVDPELAFRAEEAWDNLMMVLLEMLSRAYYTERTAETYEALHRGGPVCTGSLVDDTLTCPWHGFQYNVANGQLLVDPAASLATYAVSIEDGQVVLQVPAAGAPAPSRSEVKPRQDNEFKASDVPPGSALLVQNVAVFNVGGVFYATQDECTHKRGPLSEGGLDGSTVTCPYHGAQFDVCTGQVLRGRAAQPLKT